MAHHQRCIPCPGEVRRLGPLAQFVGGLAAHADGIAGAGDGAHDGERVDEVRLTARSPAIGAATGGGGGREGEDGFVLVRRSGWGG